MKDLEFLRNLLGAYYYQTVWEDFDSHETIWSLYIQDAGKDNTRVLTEQIDALLQKHPEVLFQFVEKEIGAGGLYFNNAQEAVEWLKRCQSYMQAALASSSG